MADIRELIILSPGALDPRRETVVTRILADLRMFIRRFVVRTARNGIMRRFYKSIYDFHLWIAVQLGSRFAGTRAVYLSSGMATELNIGVSDVDIAMYGNWPEKRQFLLMKIFGLLTVLSPLFDRRSLGSIGTVEDLQHLCATDMFMALTHAKARLQWKLLFGEDVIAMLPDIAPNRFAGCVYMDVRRWWSMLASITFGNDVTARDTIFHNTICFKAVAELLRAERMLDGEIDITPRRALIEQESRTDPSPALEMLRIGATKNFLQADEDPREATMQWFLSHSERFHQRVQHKPGFLPLVPVRIDGSAEETILASQTTSHAAFLAELARQHWPGLRATHLLPVISLLSPDSAALLLDVDPHHLPTNDQLRILSARHLKVSPTLPQRLAIYLLLPHAAYLLDIGGSLEFFHYTLSPATNPDVFIAIAERTFLLSGEPRDATTTMHWTPFAQELMEEELQARRGAYARFGALSRPTPIENLRNLWRFLQLLAVERTAAKDTVVLPITLAAIRRALVQSNPRSEVDLQALEEVHIHALARTGQITPNALIQRVYTDFVEASDASCEFA